MSEYPDPSEMKEGEEWERVTTPDGQKKWMRKKTTKVEVDDKITDEIADKIKKKLDEEKNAQQALDSFLQLRDKLAIQYPGVKDCKTPRELTEKIKLMDANKIPKGGGAPHGKAPFVPPDDEEQYENNARMLDKLYDRAYHHPTSPKDSKLAKEQIQRLLDTLLGSKSWSQLKERGGMDKIREGLTSLEACSQCGATIDKRVASVCPECGYDVYARQKTHRTYTKKGNKAERVS